MPGSPRAVKQLLQLHNMAKSNRKYWRVCFYLVHVFILVYVDFIYHFCHDILLCANRFQGFHISRSLSLPNVTLLCIWYFLSFDFASYIYHGNVISVITSELKCLQLESFQLKMFITELSSNPVKQCSHSYLSWLFDDILMVSMIYVVPFQ